MSENTKITTWICDSCGGTIESAQDGWVEWLTSREGKQGFKARGLRLVHHRPSSPRSANAGCQYNEHVEFEQDRSIVGDLPLQNFLPADGLMLLLSFISEGEHPVQDVLKMIKRLHIPGYEHARRHFTEAIHEGVFEPNTKEDYFRQSDIRAVLSWVAKRRD